MSNKNIDDMLLAGNSPSIPSTPEQIDAHMGQENNELDSDAPLESYTQEEHQDKQANDDNQDLETQNEKEEPVSNLDEYGNEKAAPKTYTEDEVNERINSVLRQRFARMEKNSGQQEQIQNQVQQNFSYDENSEQTWQQQLESFVLQTIRKDAHEQNARIIQQREQQAQIEFEQKFRNGMSKFSDYQDVVASQPFSDAMVIATRSMSDPAAFMYAASKRAPQELQRIANIPDHYAQIVEIGKLEERLKKPKMATKAPKPISKTNGNINISHKEDKQPSINDLIARADAQATRAICEQALMTGRKKFVQNEELQEKRKPFIESFVEKFAPLNNMEGNKKREKHGSYRGIPFTVTESRSSYWAEVLKVKRKFTSAWDAARWLEEMIMNEINSAPKRVLTYSDYGGYSDFNV